MKVLQTTLVILLLPTAALAQQRTYYDGAGRVVGRSATDSPGTTTFYDSGGRVSARSSTSGNMQTIYDPGGRVIGRTYRSKVTERPRR
ncbi:hypothetical protein [Bradyrhizobium neotropicale]|uniref:hypothetical protein n=1 Tax=Bradyrhizobium neotropicale TaxID=1497615 RepID=UPI001AD72954|nr:hypothetical protein [Bradyrhizobium neotropicale]MBO4221978.1 hypothetical protein [Bradyrhizobium neotropicale]